MALLRRRDALAVQDGGVAAVAGPAGPLLDCGLADLGVRHAVATGRGIRGHDPASPGLREPHTRERQGDREE
eukprot:10500503-Lingulodinium_polyedra.AAC.1